MKLLATDRAYTMITVYDYPFARALDGCGFDFFLLGDSLGMVALGLENTRQVTMDMMLHHLAAVKRGTRKTHIIADMPIHTYDTPEQSLENARRFIKAGADSVKVEGPCIDIVKTLNKNNIDSIGHIGLTPQTALDYKIQGTVPGEAQRLLREAHALEDAGCFALVIEHVPAKLAKTITEQLTIPTIGIGAGPFTSGQVLVLNDILGLSPRIPPFAKKYVDLSKTITQAACQFVEEVKNKEFPSQEYYT